MTNSSSATTASNAAMSAADPATRSSQARSAQRNPSALAEVFAWLRPDDLIWNYWVNNYLQGRDPAPLNILFWNADTTRMTAALHRDFLALALRNALVRPGAASMLGVPVDLSPITVDGYVVAGVADHISPWEACYRSAQLFGGHTRFVLSTSGHIAAIVNPPGNRKATYQVGTDMAPDPAGWQRETARTRGSWWPVRWSRAGPARSGARRLRPRPMSVERAPSTRMISASGRRLPIQVRPGDPRRTPLLLVNGIGAGFESFDPLVDALHPDRPVIRFDPPGIGGSPGPTWPYRLPGLARTILALLDVLGVERGRRAGRLLGRRAGATVRVDRRAAVPTARADSHRHRDPHGACPPPRPRPYGDPAPLHRPDHLRRIAPAIYGGTARHDPQMPARLLHHRQPRRIAPRLRPATAGRRRLDQPPVPAVPAAAEPGPHRRRRPDHPHRQRTPARRAHPPRPAAGLPRAVTSN
jgi:alpha/beta hydrolase family protein